MTDNEKRILLMLTSNPDTETYFDPDFKELRVGIDTNDVHLINAAHKLFDAGFPVSIGYLQDTGQRCFITPWTQKYNYLDI